MAKAEEWIQQELWTDEQPKFKWDDIPDDQRKQIISLLSEMFNSIMQKNQEERIYDE